MTQHCRRRNSVFGRLDRLANSIWYYFSIGLSDATFLFFNLNHWSCYQVEIRNIALEKQVKEMAGLQLQLDTEREEKRLLQEQLHEAEVGRIYFKKLT